MIKANSKLKQKKPKAKRKEPKTNISFELCGRVYIVEKTKNGKIIEKNIIDGEIVLKCLIRVLKDALDEATCADKEQWLWDNPKALAQVKRGLKQSGEGKVKAIWLKSRC